MNLRRCQQHQHPLKLALASHDRCDLLHVHLADILAVDGNDAIAGRDLLGEDARRSDAGNDGPAQVGPVSEDDPELAGRCHDGGPGEQRPRRGSSGRSRDVLPAPPAPRRRGLPNIGRIVRCHRHAAVVASLTRFCPGDDRRRAGRRPAHQSIAAPANARGGPPRLAHHAQLRLQPE